MRIALLGDLALIGKYDLTANSNAKLALEKMACYLSEFDYVIANLETPLTNLNRTSVCKSMHLKSPPINIEILKYLNISAVSLANNHAYDYGIDGLNDTITTLKRNNIDYFGVNGKTIKLDGIVVRGYCCFSTNGNFYKNNSRDGLHPLNFQNVLNDIESDKLNKNISLLSLHWGDEHTNYPKYDHIKFARLMANTNTVVISGHHPHVIQGIEESDGSIIAYSQGNFCFDECKSISKSGLILKQNEDNRESFILEVTVNDGCISNYKIAGIREVDGGLIFDSIEEKMKTISNSILKISDIGHYETQRQLQISNPEFRLTKFGKKDAKWYIDRLNYFSIGAFFLNKLNSYRYKRFFLRQLNLDSKN